MQQKYQVFILETEARCEAITKYGQCTNPAEWKLSGESEKNLCYYHLDELVNQYRREHQSALWKTREHIAQQETIQTSSVGKHDTSPSQKPPRNTQ